jgi:hypothetical protein
MERIKIMFLVLMMFLLVGNKILASGFNVSSIGSVATGGRQITKWWYTGLQPTIEGEGLAGTVIDVTVDGVVTKVDVTSDGEWSYTPASALTEGEHTVVLANSGAQMSFTLVLGTATVDWNAVNSEASVSTLPTVGVTWPTWTLPIVGLGLLGFSAKIGINAKK